jgi:hypothetical protein
MSVLLESFVRDAPTEAHLTGLAACVIAWLTTEDLLARLVGAQAPEVWRWLARRPFITSGPRGLTIHDLARDVLDAEFERRAPERYHEYHRIIHAHTVAGLRNATGLDRQVHGQRLLFLLRNSPLTSAFAALRARGSASVVPGRPDEHDQVCAIVERFEGTASAGLLRSWLTEQPEHLSVVRAGDRVAGFAYHVFSPGGSSLEEQDPVVRACLRHAHRTGPARPGELVSIARFIGGTQDDQRDPYAVLAACVSSLVEWLTRPLAWSFCTVVDDEYWAPLFDHAAFERVLAVDGYVALAIDWRRFPVDKWLALMRERGHSGGSGPPPAAILRPRPLDRDRFDAAVRAALPVLHRPDQLAASPLIGSALAATDAGPTVEQLRATIEAAVACLAQEPKGDQLRAVLNRTYLRPAANREAAAEVLGLPFSTYRRYLAKALEQLTDLLWTVEIGGVHL